MFRRTGRILVVGTIVAVFSGGVSAEAVQLGAGRYQTASWTYQAQRPYAALCVGEKVWFQYNMAPANNAAAYGTRVVATNTNTVPANQVTAVLNGTFFAPNQFAPLTLSTTPLGCRGVRVIQAGWLAAMYHVLKWNAATGAWEHCKGIPIVYSDMPAWSFSATSATSYTAPPTVVPVLCGSGYYFVEGESWVYDGATWRGGTLQWAPNAGVPDYVYVSESTYRAPAPSGETPQPPVRRPAGVSRLRMIDSSGAPWRGSNGRELVVEIGRGPVGPPPAAQLPPPAGFSIERAFVDGVEEAVVSVTDERAAALALAVAS